jgi:hypothetical protein
MGFWAYISFEKAHKILKKKYNGNKISKKQIKKF